MTTEVVEKDEQVEGKELPDLESFIQGSLERQASAPRADDDEGGEDEPRAEEEVLDASGEAEPVASDAQPNFWDQTVPDNDPSIENPFFRGKPIRELYKSAETNYAIRQDLKRERDDLRAKLAAYEAIDHYVKQARDARESLKPPEDPWAKRGINPEVDPIARPKEYSEAVVDIATERLRKEHEQQLRQFKEESLRESQQAAFERSAIDAIRQAEAGLAQSGIAPDRFRRILPWIMNDIYESGGKDNPELLLHPQNFVTGWERARMVFSDDSPAPVQAPASQQGAREARVVVNKPGTPPGAKKAAQSASPPQKSAGASVATPVRTYIDQAVEMMSQHGVPGFEDTSKAREAMYERAARRGGRQ